MDHEIKFDGYRVQVHLANEAVRIFTRRGHDWTHRFKKVSHDAWHIKAASAVLDGEIVVPILDGTTDFAPAPRLRSIEDCRYVLHDGTRRNTADCG